MNPKRWRQIEQLYHSALEQDAAGPDAFLTEACRENADLRREVESLLAELQEKANQGKQTGTLRQRSR
jgi:eukaryotic-like serine/threonine-protein kinase